MSELATAMAKLAGIRQALESVANENVSRSRGAGDVKTRSTFSPAQVQHYFLQASRLVEALRKLRPDIYLDFQTINVLPSVQMVATTPGQPAPAHYSREQVLQVVRDVDQIFEIRANSQLEQPRREAPRCVFITHGRSNDWRAVQAHAEKDLHLETVELAQEPAMGRTIIEKLEDNAGRCNSAVIVMTGDDAANDGGARVRENVMHEIGFFQGRYGRQAVILLHEEGVSIPTNLSGLVYVPFPKGSIEAAFHVLGRELKAIYK